MVAVICAPTHCKFAQITRSDKQAVVLVVAIVAAFAACSKSSKDDKGSTSQITAAVTDSNGEAVTDENGVIVTEKVGGEVVTDKSGKAVTEVVTRKRAVKPLPIKQVKRLRRS